MMTLIFLLKCQQKNPKKSSKYKTKQGFRWTNEMVQALLNCSNDLKSGYQLKGLDFESDLIKMYNEIGRLMAERFENSGFGPVSESEIANELSPNEFEVHKLKVLQEKKT